MAVLAEGHHDYLHGIQFLIAKCIAKNNLYYVACSVMLPI